MSQLETVLRLCSGLIIALSAILVGFIARSQWIILLFGMVFAVLYVLGNRAKFNTSLSLMAHIKDISIHYLVQVILCGVLYLIGRGLGSLLHDQPIASFSIFDVFIALGLLLFGLITTFFLRRFEKVRPSSSLSSAVPSHEISVENRCEYVLAFDAVPITLDNFYESVFYGHLERDGSGQLIKNEALPEAARPSAQLIADTEARLGVLFPPLLKQLYLRQNGGDVGNLWVPCVNQPTNELAQWRGVFSHDYCYLAPLQQLTTLYDSYLDYMDEEEIAQSPHVQKHAKDYIILCQRYADTTFLDYSMTKAQPRVGVVDFDGIEKNDVWFDTFDEFFAALRRGELIDRP